MAKTDKYLPKEIDAKWQEKWKKDKIFSPNLDQAKKPYFALMMFPYPSAEGLHVGNMYAFIGADIFARFMRMQGEEVFEPMGLDGFGIHSENYALKIKKHPVELSQITEKRFYGQLAATGNAFAWDRTTETYKPEYYKWTQWIFLQLFKHGLAYRKKAEVNWCPSCKTVLADEQVIAGRCERCNSVVTRKLLEQWFFKITDYADRLLANLEKLDWSKKVLNAQKNWIGKQEGAEIKFQVASSKLHISVFTTRPDTIFGATFIVLSPEYGLIDEVLGSKSQEIKAYVAKAKKATEIARTAPKKEKTGVFTGLFAINPANGKEIPIWIADYVTKDYGTGAVMGVPGSDLRDFEFAKKFKLPIIKVIGKTNKDTFAIKSKKEVLTEGFIVNSEKFDSLKAPEESIREFMTWIENRAIGKRKINYHLRDWLISRQRYWGPPIPIIYCKNCGTVPVPEKDLPVLLPYVENFRPRGTGKSPLASVPDFVNVECPTCGAKAKRETDVSDTFLDSAWYFFRYTSTDDETCAWRPERVKRWLPVDIYIGGAEHSVLHLLYARFITMVFHDIGLISHFEEPFIKFRAHGLLISEGGKMSKSKGNVVAPDEYIKEYGTDTLRLYLMFLGPFSEGGDFRDSAITGLWRFLERVWKMLEKVKTTDTLTKNDQAWMNKTIQKVTEDIGVLKYNTAISALMEWLNYLTAKEVIEKTEYANFLLLLAPFAPHTTEELWSKMNEKYSIHQHHWPQADQVHLQVDEVNIPVQVNGKLRSILRVSKNETKKESIIERALKDEKVKKYVSGKKYEAIYKEGKILNFVVK